MAKMEAETFTDVTSIVFDFVEREANRRYEIMQHQSLDGRVIQVSRVSLDLFSVKTVIILA